MKIKKAYQNLWDIEKEWAGDMGNKKGNKGVQYAQSTLHACMKMSK
jgi:hypothetical protein